MQPIGAIDAQLLMASELPLEHFILSSVRACNSRRSQSLITWEGEAKALLDELKAERPATYVAPSMHPT